MLSYIVHFGSNFIQKTALRTVRRWLALTFVVGLMSLATSVRADPESKREPERYAFVTGNGYYNANGSSMDDLLTACDEAIAGRGGRCSLDVRDILGSGRSRRRREAGACLLCSGLRAAEQLVELVVRRLQRVLGSANDLAPRDRATPRYPTPRTHRDDTRGSRCRAAGMAASLRTDHRRQGFPARLPRWPRRGLAGESQEVQRLAAKASLVTPIISDTLIAGSPRGGPGS